MWNAFYRRPRILILTIALLLVSGLSALQVLPRREDPELVTRNAKIVTVYPGANAERIESQVSDKIEEELAELDEITIIESFSSAGVSVVTIELDEAIVEVDQVWSKVRDKLDDAEAELPDGASSPDFEESTITAFTLIVGLTWDDQGFGPPNRAILGRLADDLEDMLEGLPGTDDVELYGEPDEEIRVLIDADRLASLGLTPDDLARAIEQADAKVPAGNVRGNTRDLLIEVEGEFEALRRISEVPIQTGANGSIVRLSELARLEKAEADPPAELALVAGSEGILVAARMRPGIRVDTWVAQAREALSEFEAGLPAGLALDVLFDQGHYTAKRLDSLFSNLALAAGLVMLVVFFMMGWRSALLVGTALPLTVLAVLASMRALGIPMHQMSVTGLIIALGLLIDNAIVMTDDVRQELAAGHPPGEAIRRAVKHLAVPLLGSTLTTILAFMPLVIVPGAVGEFVGAMSLAVILAVASSLLISLTVIPALTGWLERWRPVSGKATFWSRGLASTRLTAFYRSGLALLIRRPWLGLGTAALLPILGLVAGSTLQEQFFPPSGRDQVQAELHLPEGTAIAHTREVAEAARRAMLDHPAVEDVHWVVGGSAPKFYYNMLETQEGSPQYAQAMIQLSTEDNLVGTVRELQELVDAATPEGQLIIRQLEQGPPFQAPIVVRLLGPDVDVLHGLSDRVRRELAALPQVTHTKSTLDNGRAKLLLAPDEEELVAAGLDRTELARRLQGALEGSLGGSLFEGGEELPVRVRLEAAERTTFDRLAALELANEDGWTNLSALGSLALVPEAGSIPRRNGQRLSEVHGYVAAGTLVADSLDGLQQRLAADGFALPSGYRMEFGGEGEERDEAVGRLASTVGVLLVLMVATLVLSLASFRMASIIGAVAFLSVGLALGSLWLFGYPFGFMAIVGTMGLIGIAINDAIVVLSALRADPAASSGDVDGIVEVLIRSSRHVFSTTITTVAGFLPLIFSSDGLWPPLAVAIAGGVVGATLLALLLVPSAFRIVSARRMPSPSPALEPALA